jgi:uncharacterized protein (TIGR01777 family)
VKVVIAGGSGLLGRSISQGLLAAGHEPVVLARDPVRASSRLPGVRVAPWDPNFAGEWRTELKDAGAVVNLAGASIGRWPWTSRRRAELVGSRVGSTRALVDAIAALPPENRPAVLLNASGTDLYEGRDETPADETTEPSDTFLSHLVVAWEAEARKAEALGVRVVLMRASPVIAPGAASLGVEALPVRLFVGGRLGSGRQWTSWVDIDDVVGLYRLALEAAEIHGPLNLAAPDVRTQIDFVRALGSALHRPIWFPTPAWLIRLVLGQQATLALGSRRVWPARALASGYAFKRPRLEDSLANAFHGRAAAG